MRITATELRSNLYRVLDRVASTGEPVEIVRGGQTLEIVVQRKETPKTFSLDRLVAHPGAVTGDAGDLAEVEWSDAWKPFPAGRP